MQIRRLAAADRVKSRADGDAGELNHQNLHDGVVVIRAADFTTSSVFIVILADRANQPDEIAQVEAFQAATAAISSANPTYIQHPAEIVGERGLGWSGNRPCWSSLSGRTGCLSIDLNIKAPRG